MNLVMTILAKDEDDILRANIEYHRSQGVDYFIAMDNASTDQTSDILKHYQQQGILKYIYEDGPYHQTKWVTEMARMAYAEFNADWVINNDADEFWWPLNGNLKTALEQIPKKYQVVRAIRHNLLLCEEKSTDPFYKKMTYRRETSLNPVGKPLPPKVCHRGNPSIVTAPGNHSIKDINEEDIFNGALEIYHYPYRNLEQLKRKVKNIGEGYYKSCQVNEKTGTGPGLATREIYKQYQENPANLDTFFAKNILNHNQISIGLAIGELVKEKRLADYLSNLLG
jgi:hypothetical protein